MTEDRVCANNRALSRDELQAEALVIQKLIDTAMALHLSPQPETMFDTLALALERACSLHEALDSIHVREMAK